MGWKSARPSPQTTAHDAQWGVNSVDHTTTLRCGEPERQVPGLADAAFFRSRVGDAMGLGERRPVLELAQSHTAHPPILPSVSKQLAISSTRRTVTFARSTTSKSTLIATATVLDHSAAFPHLWWPSRDAPPAIPTLPSSS